MSPTIAVYAIFRDERDHVAAWAENTGDANHRFVLDTGSTDDTVAELREHGIGYARASFDPFRFDDARNAALALTPDDFDLYVRLDADERLPDDWRTQLDAAYDPHVNRYRYRVVNTDGIWGQHTRDDIHQRRGFRWRYPTHEVLVGPMVTVDMPRFVVTHTHQGRRSHHNTNLDTLARAVIEYPGDHRMVFYLAREFWYAGAWSDCRIAMVDFLALPNGWGPERCEGYRILAAIDAFPERWLWKAVGESPLRREPWVDLTRLYLQRGEIRRAQTLLDIAASHDDDTIYTTDPACWGPAFDELIEQVERA